MFSSYITGNGKGFVYATVSRLYWLYQSNGIKTSERRKRPKVDLDQMDPDRVVIMELNYLRFEV